MAKTKTKTNSKSKPKKSLISTIEKELIRNRRVNAFKAYQGGDVYGIDYPAEHGCMVLVCVNCNKKINKHQDCKANIISGKVIPYHKCCYK